MHIVLVAAIGLLVMLGIAGLIILACIFLTSEPVLTILSWLFLACVIWILFF